jgi:hypothetical protein
VAVGLPPDSNALGFEWCEIRRWRGYVTSTFYAVTATGAVIAESSPFRWRKAAAPPPETPAARAAYDALVAALAAAGWKIADEAPDGSWYGTRFTRSSRGPWAAPVGPVAVEAAPVAPRAVPAAPAAPHPAPVPAPQPQEDEDAAPSSAEASPPSGPAQTDRGKQRHQQGARRSGSVRRRRHN